MKYLIFLLFTLIPTNKVEEEVIAIVKVVYINNQVYLSIDHDSTVYTDACDVLEHLALEYKFQCIDDKTVKTKKL